MQCDSGLLNRGWTSSAGLRSSQFLATFMRPAGASEGPHPPPSRLGVEIFLVNFKVQKTPKKCFLPLVLKAVSSGLLSCLENLKITFSYIEHLYLISLTLSS